MSIFKNLQMLPDDPIFGIIPLFNEDPHEKKINLAIGSYKDENGNPYLLKSVKKAEELIFQKNLNKEYQAFEGDSIYRQETLKLIFGEDSNFIKHDEIFCAQTIGASGALFLGASLLKKMGINHIALSNPTWSNHSSIMLQAGMQFSEYPYYDFTNKNLKFDEFCNSLNNLSPQNVVLFHASCHNPTGIDPTEEEWKILASICKDKELIPFFDCAYQGFNENIDNDVSSIRIFANFGLPLLIAYSYSKNFGLYGERAGALCILTHDKELTKIIESHVKNIIRSNYSSPPLHVARIVKTILTTPELKIEWQNELFHMCERIKSIRALLVEKLRFRDYSFIKKQHGMFGFLGFEEAEVRLLRKKFGIFMPLNSRINIAGLNLYNIEYFVNSLNEITQ